VSAASESEKTTSLIDAYANAVEDEANDTAVIKSALARRALSDYIAKLEAVADAARNRSQVWTRETFVALDNALKALDAGDTVGEETARRDGEA
jgi:hypothetical protein